MFCISCVQRSLTICIFSTLSACSLRHQCMQTDCNMAPVAPVLAGTQSTASILCCLENRLDSNAEWTSSYNSGWHWNLLWTIDSKLVSISFQVSFDSWLTDWGEMFLIAEKKTLSIFLTASEFFILPFSSCVGPSFASSLVHVNPFLGDRIWDSRGDNWQ